MFKKTLISLAVASSVGLTGCFDSGETGANANPDYQIEDTTIDRSIVRPIYNPNPIAEEPAFPINADLILLLSALLRTCLTGMAQISPVKSRLMIWMIS